ncbi:MAG: hypothetical protein AAFR17_19275 [Pseudomonadota bacterium]
MTLSAIQTGKPLSMLRLLALSLLLVFLIVLPGLLWMLFSRRKLEMVP